MVLNGIPISENQCIGDSLDAINNAFITLSANVLKFTPVLSAGIPSFAPLFIGQEYLNTTSSKFYKASGFNVTDWVALN